MDSERFRDMEPSEKEELIMKRNTVLTIEKFNEGFDAVIWEFPDQPKEERYSAKTRRCLEPGCWHEPFRQFEKLSEAIEWVNEQLKKWENEES